MSLIETTTNSETQFPRRSLKGYLGLLGRGFVMGSADVVPGVSGGTMAFILGIYEELIDSIRGIASPEVFSALFKLKVKSLFDLVDWKFLTAVALGILLAVFTLSHALEWLLIHHPVLLWSFFFGLIIASIVVVSGRIKQWTAHLIGLAALGALGAYLLVGAIPARTPDTWWFLILSGALAICAMILPGISGAFILVLLGKYQYVLGAVTGRDFPTLFLVGFGAVIGLITFAQLLGWFFKHYHDGTVAVLIGLMVGSLRKIWPWKVVEEFIIDRHGEVLPIVERNVLPELMLDSSFNLEIAFAAGLMLLGTGLVITLERLANRKEAPQGSASEATA